MASSLEYVSSDWVAVEVSAVAVVLPECTCGREIAAYHRSAVSSFGEHGYVARTFHAEGGGKGDHRAVVTRACNARGGRGDHGAVATGVPLATRAPYWAGPAGRGRLDCIRAVIVRTASGSSCVAPWPAATEALLSS